jgi:uncharacterized protein YlxW (UPF0749 family)
MPDPSTSANRAEGRQRLWQAFMHPRRGQTIAAVLLAALGFAAVTQVHSNDTELYAGYREQDLIDVLSGLTGTTQRARDELRTLQASRDKLHNSSSQRREALDQATTRVNTLNILAGLVPVTGPGIRVTITEKSTPTDVDTFLDLIEELRTVGAEAIAVNSQVRVVASSSFTQGNDAITIDGKQLTPPYVVEAIGDPDTLAGAVTFTRGPQDEFESAGDTVLVEQLPSLTIQAVASKSNTQYSIPQSGQ